MSTGTTLAAIELLTALLHHATQLSLLLQQAQAEGRELNAEEWDGVIRRNTEAVDRLETEIAKARGEGR